MDFDFIIVGSGAGGGTAAYKLAKSGKRVLLADHGKIFKDEKKGQDEKFVFFDRKLHEPRIININGKNSRLYVSGIVGGGTSMYGAVFMRPSTEDFTPGKYYPEFLEKNVWDMPVNYDEYEPYFEEAEDLYHVSGDYKAEFKYFRNRKRPYPGKLPELEPINHDIKQRIYNLGLNAAHLPMAINFETCLKCANCPGYLCPNDSRASSLNRCIDKVKDKENFFLLENTRAIELKKGSNGKINSIIFENIEDGNHVEYTAENYIISAGAVGSPLILKASGIKDKSDMLGRNYMYHAGALVAGFFPKKTGAAEKFIKQIGWTDDYIGTTAFNHKLGLVQMIPAPGPLSMIENSPVPMSYRFASFLHARSAIFSMTVEDLPQRENIVTLDSNNKPVIKHKFHNYDIYRSKFAKKRLTKILKKAGAIIAFGGTSEKNEHRTAHQVGTCRFGNDPKHSVLDKNCRVWEYDNLYVIDGCFLPVSLSVGPALMIVANSLRVVDNILNGKT